VDKKDLDIWNLCSMAIRGPQLDATDIGIMNDIATCHLAADPRLPPMKLLRLASAYGGYISALGAFYAAQDHVSIGLAMARRCAKFLYNLCSDLEQANAVEDDAALEQTLISRRQQRVRLDGYGVPVRAVDERAAALMRCVVRRNRDKGVYYRLMLRCNQILTRLYRLPVNLAGVLAAISLDIGFTPEQLHAMSIPFTIAPFLANIAEGSQQAPSLLQCLPTEVIAYAGPPPRLSPRSIAQVQS
jgi:hypothetical protein